MKRAAFTELVAISNCFIVGLIVGVAGSGLAETLEWPNIEMSSRGDLKGVIAGILIAIPSGYFIDHLDYLQSRRSIINPWKQHCISRWGRDLCITASSNCKQRA